MVYPYRVMHNDIIYPAGAEVPEDDAVEQKNVEIIPPKQEVPAKAPKARSAKGRK